MPRWVVDGFTFALYDPVVSLPGWTRAFGLCLMVLLVLLALVQVGVAGHLGAFPALGAVGVLGNPLGSGPSGAGVAGRVGRGHDAGGRSGVDDGQGQQHRMVCAGGLQRPGRPDSALPCGGGGVVGHTGHRGGALGDRAVAGLAELGGGHVHRLWSAWAARYRIELLERVYRAEEVAAAARVVADRQRLARDLHDVVAHTLAVTVLHLGGARLAVSYEPAEAAAAIEEAERLAHRSMNELRQVVRVLAEDHSSLPVSPASPQPTAGELPGLLDEYRHAGLDLSSTMSGDLSAVVAPVGMVAYRVVQEALANASRHGPGGHTDVDIKVGTDGALRLVVTNPCQAASGRGGGIGLRAMTERVRAVGGQVTAGCEGRDWVVRAELPG